MKRKLPFYAAVAFVLFLIVQDPTGTAGTAANIGAAVATAAEGVGDFLTALAGE